MRVLACLFGERCMCMKKACWSVGMLRALLVTEALSILELGNTQNRSVSREWTVVFHL